MKRRLDEERTALQGRSPPPSHAPLRPTPPRVVITEKFLCVLFRDRGRLRLGKEEEEVGEGMISWKEGSIVNLFNKNLYLNYRDIFSR